MLTKSRSILQSVDSATGFRSYSASAFYQPASHRPNLCVLTEAQVQKVTFEGRPPRATDALFRHRSTAFEVLHPVSAKREVILCGGSFHSPQILELSGIGSGDLLRSLGIPVVVDNPHVGENLQGHMLAPLCWEAVDGVETLDALAQDPEKLAAAMEEFRAAGKGPLSAVCSSGANLSYSQIGGRSSSQSTPDHLPRCQQEFGRRQHDLLLRALVDSLATALQVALIPCALWGAGSDTETEKGQFFSVLVTLSRPLSRGTVHVVSADVRDPPAIDPRYLEHPVDVRVTAEALLWAQRLVTTTPPLLEMLGRDADGMVKQRHPVLRTAEDATAWAHAGSTTEFYPLGTCAIGPEGGGGVVDERLRVQWGARTQGCGCECGPDDGAEYLAEHCVCHSREGRGSDQGGLVGGVDCQAWGRDESVSWPSESTFQLTYSALAAPVGNDDNFLIYSDLGLDQTPISDSVCTCPSPVELPQQLSLLKFSIHGRSWPMLERIHHLTELIQILSSPLLKRIHIKCLRPTRFPIYVPPSKMPVPLRLQSLRIWQLRHTYIRQLGWQIRIENLHLLATLPHPFLFVVPRKIHLVLLIIPESEPAQLTGQHLRDPLRLAQILQPLVHDFRRGSADAFVKVPVVVVVVLTA